ncbi:MAG: carbon monoxide dehydrogenase, partial [Desulfobacteraceae bacterium]|nr:carbon monoxide dehydrogenase [Desulfobacteraceae bacterium]
MEEKAFSTVGRVTRRKDGISKVTGREIYSSDLSLPNMLYARVLRSPYPHAKILSIDTTNAEKMGAVCITPDSIPKIRYNERQVSIPEKTYRDRTVLPDKARHVGEGIAAVAARTEALAEKALQQITVKYERLPAVFDPFEAMKPEAPALYKDVML